MYDTLLLPKSSRDRNQQIKPHEKDGMVTMNRPSQSHNSVINKYDTAVTENLKRINELMKKIL